MINEEEEEYFNLMDLINRIGTGEKLHYLRQREGEYFIPVFVDADDVVFGIDQNKKGQDWSGDSPSWKIYRPRRVVRKTVYKIGKSIVAMDDYDRGMTKAELYPLMCNGEKIYIEEVGEIKE